MASRWSSLILWRYISVVLRFAPEHEEQEAAVAGFVADAFGGGQMLVNFGSDQVFAILI
jgi:hypothetical protein